MTLEEICSVIEELISEGITESEFLNFTKKKTTRPVVKWTKEKDKIVFLLVKQYGRNYEKKRYPNYFYSIFFERKVDEYKHFSNFIYIFLIYKTS